MPAVVAMTASLAIVLASCVASAAHADSSASPAPPVNVNPPSALRDFAADIAQAKDWQRKGMNRQALALLTADHRLDPTNRDVTVALAETASFAGEQGQAIALLDPLLQASPDDVDARIVLARAYAFNHDYPAAESQYDKALTIAPDDADAQVGLAQTYSFEGRFTDAEHLYRTVLKRDPKNFDALTGLAGAESFAGDYRRARADFRSVLDAQPDNSDALVGMATVEYWLNDLPAAISFDDRALALDPGDSDARDLHRQLSIKFSPQVVSTLTTSHSDDGSTFDSRVEERFFTAPTMAFGVVQELYRIGNGQGSVQTHKLGLTATYQGSNRFGAAVSLLGSKYGGVPSVTDSVLSVFGEDDGVGYGAGVSTGGVDGSVAANGGITNTSQASALVRVNTSFASLGYTHRATAINFGGQSAVYDDGNHFHDFTVDASHRFDISSRSSITPDIGLREAGFSVTYNTRAQTLAPGYYSYLYQRDVTLTTTVNRQLTDRLALGVIGTLGVRNSTVPVYFNPNPKYGKPIPTFFTDPGLAFQSFEPFFDYEGDRFSLAGAFYDDHYRGGVWTLPYQANTIDMTFSVRLP